MCFFFFFVVSRSDNRLLLFRGKIVTHITDYFGFLLTVTIPTISLSMHNSFAHTEPSFSPPRSWFVSGNLSKSWEPTYSRWLPEIIIQPQCKSPTTLYNSLPGKNYVRPRKLPISILPFFPSISLFFFFFWVTRKN